MQFVYAYDEILPSAATDTEQVLNTVAALARAGHRIELVVPGLRGRERPSAENLKAYYQVEGSFEIRALPSHLDRVRPLQKAAHALSAVRAVDVRQVVWYTRNLPCAVAGLSGGYEVLYEHWRPWPDQYPPLEPVLRALFRHRRFLGAILHSDYARRSYERMGIPSDLLTTIHNGYDPRRMEPRLSQSDARRRLGLPAQAPLAVYAGRIHERKGIGSLLELARRCPEATIVLVGSEGEGAVEQRARALPNVRVFPWQRFKETVVYLYAADVLLLPLTAAPLQVYGTSALPMKVFLYLATGRPILGPAAPDLLELLGEGNAALVPPDNLEAAAKALRRLIESRQERERLGQAGFATARELTWDRRAERIVSFVNQRRASGAESRAWNGAWSKADWSKRSIEWSLEQSARRIRSAIARARSGGASQAP